MIILKLSYEVLRLAYFRQYNKIPLSIILKERYGLSQDEANELRNTLMQRGVTPQQIRTLDIPPEKIPEQYEGREQITPKLTSLMEAGVTKDVKVKEGYGSTGRKEEELKYYNLNFGGRDIKVRSMGNVTSYQNVYDERKRLIKEQKAEKRAEELRNVRTEYGNVNAGFYFKEERRKNLSIVPVSSALYNKYITDEFGYFPTRSVTNPFTNVTTSQIIPLAKKGETSWLQSERFRLRSDFTSNRFDKTGLLLNELSSDIKRNELTRKTSSDYFSKAREINIFGGGIKEIPSRAGEKFSLNWKGLITAPIFNNKENLTIGKTSAGLFKFATYPVAGYSTFFEWLGRSGKKNVGINTSDKSSTFLSGFPTLNKGFGDFTKNYFGYNETNAKSYFTSDVKAGDWSILSNPKVETAGIVTGLGLAGIVSPIIATGTKWFMLPAGAITTYVGYTTDEPDIFASGLGMFALSNPLQRAIYNPVSVGASEFFGITRKPESYGFNWVEDFTIPQRLGQLKAFEGKNVRTTSVSDTNPYGLGYNEFDIIATPERAEAWRVKYNLFGLYKSSPTEFTDVSVKLGGRYDTNLGKWISVDKNNFGSLPFNIPKKPNAYLAYGLDLGTYTEMPKDIRFNKGITNVLYFENDYINPNPSSNSIRGLVAKQNVLGGTFIPAQNVYGMSNEGQFVSPVGTTIQKTGSSSYTFYRQANPYADSSGFFGSVKRVMWGALSTATGSKYNLLRIIPSKTIPISSNLLSTSTNSDTTGIKSSSSNKILSISSPISVSLGYRNIDLYGRSSYISSSYPKISSFGISRSSSSRKSLSYSSISSRSSSSYSSSRSSSGLSSNSSRSSSSILSSLSSSLSSTSTSSSYSSSGLSSNSSSSNLSSSSSIIIPSYYGRRKRKGSRGKTNKKDYDFMFKPKYVASVEAGIRGITGRKPNKPIIESGLTIRPLTKII